MVFVYQGIIGTGISGDMKERRGAVPGIQVAGRVEKLAEECRAVAFAVLPLQWGAGTHVGLAESLLLGRTCVETSYALRGYRKLLHHGESLLAGGSPEDLT